MIRFGLSFIIYSRYSDVTYTVVTHPIITVTKTFSLVIMTLIGSYPFYYLMKSLLVGIK